MHILYKNTLQFNLPSHLHKAKHTKEPTPSPITQKSTHKYKQKTKNVHPCTKGSVHYIQPPGLHTAMQMMSEWLLIGFQCILCSLCPQQVPAWGNAHTQRKNNNKKTNKNSVFARGVEVCQLHHSTFRPILDNNANIIIITNNNNNNDKWYFTVSELW